MILNLHIIERFPQTGRTTSTQLWQQKGNQDNVWRLAHVNLPASPLGNFTVRFTATRGTGTAGDIAIDDLSISDGMFAKSFILICTVNFMRTWCNR